MKNAFTLAEVLITLTIIGVIAALTIPNLMQKQQNHANYVALKKTYSILQNAYKLAVRENGNFNFNANDANGITTEQFAEAIKPFLKYEKFCNNTAGCWTLTKEKFGGNMGNGSTRLGKNLGFKLSDGSNIIIVGTRCSTNAIWYALPYSPAFCYIIIDVDVNGAKGPNEGGKDVFAFAIKDDKVIPTGIGTNDRNMDSSYRPNGCNRTKHSGITCAFKALQEGRVDTYYDD